MKVTLEQLRTAGPCKEGYNRGVRLLQGKPFTKEDAYRTTYLGCDHALPIPLEEIAERLGLQEALWATRCLVGHDRDLRLYAVWSVLCPLYTSDAADDTPRVAAGGRLTIIKKQYNHTPHTNT